MDDEGSPRWLTASARRSDVGWRCGDIAATRDELRRAYYPKC